MMNFIQLDVVDSRDIQELFDLAGKNENIDIIQGKNFSGDITTIELYISMAVNVMAVVVPLLKTLIKQNKLSSLKINGDKIELINVSEELIEKVLEQKLKISEEMTNETQAEDRLC